MPQWIQTIWTSALAIAVLFIMTRLLGYRQISQLNYFQYINGITIGSIAAMTSTEVDRLSVGLASMSVWAGAALLIEWLSMKSKTVRNVFEGKGVVLIKQGKILEDNLKQVRYSSDELLQQLRQKNAFKAADVEFAMLEPTGQLSVLLKKKDQPLTARQLGIQAPSESEPKDVIMDGNIMEEALAQAGYNPGWLHEQINKIGVTLDNIYLGQVDAYGQLYVDLYDDQLSVPQPQEKQLLLAGLKKGAADLELFALGAKNNKAKRLYSHSAAKLNQVLDEISPYLKS